MFTGYQVSPIVATMGYMVGAASAFAQIEPITTPYDDAVGFYEHRGDLLCLTWRPEGGLNLLAIEPQFTKEHGGPRLWAIVPDESGALAWEGSTLAFRRDGAEVTAIDLTGGERAGTLKRRLDEPFTQHQVAWTSGDVRLVGTAMIPTGQGPFPGAAIIQGSGASSRSNVWAWTFADGLAKRGIAAIIPDKRGSGRSGGDWMTADFDVLAHDAAGSLAALRSLEAIDDRRAGLVGLSQGGWVAPVAARISDGAFAASLVTAMATPGEQIRHDMEQVFRAGGMPEPVLAEALRVIDLLRGYLRTGEGWDAYDEAATAFRASVGPEVASAFPADRDTPILDFFSMIFDFDFAAALDAYGGPAYLMLGAVDHLDNVPIDLTLARLGQRYAESPRADLQVQVYPKMGHALGEQRIGWVSPVVLDDLASWIRWRTENPWPEEPAADESE